MREPADPMSGCSGANFRVRCVAKLHTPDQGRVLMGIHRVLAGKLKAKGIQDTTFSIDALGSHICNSWDQVDAANDSKPFNIVIIGAGMFGAYCAEKLFRRDTSNKLRILVLDAGALFLPTHVNNLP